MRGAGAAECGELPFQLAGGARAAVGRGSQQLMAGLQALSQAADAQLRVEREDTGVSAAPSSFLLMSWALAS